MAEWIPSRTEVLEGIEGVLHGSFSRRLLVNVYHGTDRVMEDLAFEEWMLTGDLDAAVSHSGSGTIVYESVAGESLTPQGTRGVLSPFRARVELIMEITAGGWRGRVSLGTFRVVAAGPARDHVSSRGGRRTERILEPSYIPDPDDPGTFIPGG